MLVTGSDAGNFLVLHGPTVQHEIELWVAAGIPVESRCRPRPECSEIAPGRRRIGTIEKGKEATLLVVDGNPLQDVHALSSISNVFLKGERVARTTIVRAEIERCAPNDNEAMNQPRRFSSQDNKEIIVVGFGHDHRRGDSKRLDDLGESVGMPDDKHVAARPPESGRLTMTRPCPGRSQDECLTILPAAPRFAECAVFAGKNCGDLCIF